MAVGDKIVVPAMAAGFASFWGQIGKSDGDTLKLPEGMINIGGNGYGYLLAAEPAWNPLAEGCNDGSFGALALGDDIYIYAVRDPSGTAKWIASKNSTVPTGYDADTSRKVGGFHFGRYRGLANRYNTSYIPIIQIVPNSCWDLMHRPTCDPTGMVEVAPGTLWADIYLASEGSGAWPDNVPVSRYNATPIRDNVYSRADFHQLIMNAGKRFGGVEEYLRYAEGSPAGLDANNNQAWSATANTGPVATGAVAKAVSQYNVVDAVGNLWEWLDEHFDIADSGGGVTSFVWDSAAVNTGKDSAIPRGSVNHAAWRAFMGGGGWSNGACCGARCLYSRANPWDAGGSVGFRGVCDSL